MSPAEIYSSPWHHPGLLLPAALAGLTAVAVALHRHPAAWSPFLRAWLLFFAVEIVLDASLTGFATPLHGHPAAERVAGIAFVILGDLRGYLLLERLLAPSRPWGATLARAVAWSFVASIAVAVAKTAAPATFNNTRHIFLFYELVSLALFVAWRFVMVPRRAPGVSAPAAVLAREASLYFVVQYALWVSSDVLILSGVDLAYLLRIVPNLTYYGLFVPFVLLRSPRELKP